MASEPIKSDIRCLIAGARATAPIMTGVIPFGLVMGTVAAEAKLSLGQSLGMNWLVYAGASQLAAIGLMNRGASSAVVVATGLLINLRFILYSAAMAPYLRNSRRLTKLLVTYALTDQSYAVMVAHQAKLKTEAEAVCFFIGSAVFMLSVWHLSVLAGFIFGNILPASLALDFAVPLSFIALVVPTLRNNTYIMVALFSGVASVALYGIPYGLGLIVTALLGIGLAWRLSVSGRERG